MNGTPRTLRWFLCAAAWGVLAVVATTTGSCSTQRQKDAAEQSKTNSGPDWGRRSSYAYTMQIKSAAKLPSGNAAFDLDLNGELKLQVVGQNANEVRLLASVDKPHLKLGGKDDPEAKKVSADLEKPALFVLKDGRIADSWFAHELSGIAVGMWRTIMGALQFSSADGTETRWEAEEYDSSGRYHAEYRRNVHGHVSRRKTRYVALLDGATRSPAKLPKVAPQVKKSETSFVLSKGTIESVQQNELAATRFDQGASLDVETTVAIRLRTSAASLAASKFDQQPFLARSQRLSPDRPAVSPRDFARQEFDQLRMEGWKFPELLVELEKQAKDFIKKQETVEPREDGALDDESPSPDAVKERTEAFGALVAFLRWQSGTIERALVKIRARSAATNTLVSGLAAANTADCQNAVIGLIRDPSLDGKVKMRAMVGLARNKEPGPTAVQALREFIGDPILGGQALLGIGSMSRRLRDAGRVEETHAIREDLRKALERAGDTAMRVKVLRAISNSGDASLLPLVRQFLLHSDHQVRGAAVEATRHMRLPEVDELMAARLLVETNPEVQHSILRSAKTRGASRPLVNALAATISSAASPNIRRRAIELARLWSTDYPALKTALLKAAQNDPDPHLRAAAGETKARGEPN